MKEDYDGAEPAAASVTVRNLLLLGHLTGDAALVDRARRTLERYGPQLGRAVRVMPLMVANLVPWHGGGTQIVTAGAAEDPDTAALEAVVAAHHLPWAVTVPLGTAARTAALSAELPWVAGMAPREGHATAFVCHDFVCRAPVTDPDALAGELDGIARGAAVG